MILFGSRLKKLTRLPLNISHLSSQKNQRLARSNMPESEFSQANNSSQLTLDEQSSESYGKKIARELEKISLGSYQKKEEWVVLRNYLLPARPKKIMKLIHYLKSLPENEKLSSKELEIMEKNMTRQRIEVFKKMMRLTNETIFAQQIQYDKVYRLVKILPYYYHMLLAQTAKEEGMSQLRQTPEQLYEKLNRIHPYVREQIYRKYERIHQQDSYVGFHNNALAKFRKSAVRLPILTIRHPYELYMMDQVTESGSDLPQEQLFSTFEWQYNILFSQLSADLQLLYNYRMQKLAIDYRAQMFDISRRVGVEMEKIERLALRQFDLLNQRTLNKIQIL